MTPFMAAAGIGTRTTAGVLGPGPPENVAALALETMEILRQAGADVNARVTDTTGGGDSNRAEIADLLRRAADRSK